MAEIPTIKMTGPSGNIVVNAEDQKLYEDQGYRVMTAEEVAEPSDEQLNEELGDTAGDGEGEDKGELVPGANPMPKDIDTKADDAAKIAKVAQVKADDAAAKADAALTPAERAKADAANKAKAEAARLNTTGQAGKPPTK